MQPRDWLEPLDRGQFGTGGSAQWRKATNQADSALVVAAQSQARAVQLVRAELKRRELPITQFASQLGFRVESVRRKLRGEAWVNVKDLGAWALELDLPEVANLSVLPPAP